MTTIRVLSLLSDLEYTFTDVSPVYAAQYCAAESTGLLSWFFHASPEERARMLPVVDGKYSAGCGDWVAIKEIEA